ncbi:hypothetical protein HK099_002386 [Clydaea vesicula]|uniref:Prolyl 4-hydroxylase alpha subunit domain-containing protein n=1 Tax=Clydaea vesicula TaxID=447962 RepID=A0AAD5XZA7_9FUNG|nr:hypothetical protein HK099_002386 [Clydaea vesicula]KAJ3382795.1 hypothetical protein HDU92_004563 [Lobulomyces angularis]
MNFSLATAALKNLKSHGYVVVDNVLPEAVAYNYFNEILNVAEVNQKLLTKNSTILKYKEKTFFFDKPNIGEFDLSVEKVRAALPKIHSYLNDYSLMHLLNTLDLFPHSKNEFFSQTVKAQINFGNNGCFPIHLDADYLNLDDKRTVTSILYLNDLSDDGGGEIVLYPFPYKKIIVKPKFNRYENEFVTQLLIVTRMVLFSSKFCFHRVLKTKEPRICLTKWISTENPLKYDDASLELEDSLCLPQNRIYVSKVLLKDEWRLSLKESQLENCSTILIDNLKNDIKIIENKLQKIKNFQTVFKNFLSETKDESNNLKIKYF